MKARQHLIDAFHEAMFEEQMLYMKVQGHGPGMAGYKPELWQDWLDAVSRTTATSRALREGFDDPGSLEPRETP